MEQIGILIFFILASLVSSFLQNKKKREEELAGEPREPGPARPPLPGPLKNLPRSPGEWQEQLRRLLEDQIPPVLRPPPEPPPILAAPPVVTPATLIEALPKKQSLRERARIRASAVRVAPWTQNPKALRDAFVASLIFSPPVALAPPDERRAL